MRLLHEEVLYIAYMFDHVAVHTLDRGRFLSLEHLRDLEARLPADRHFRIHRSHIVRLGALEKAHRDHVIIAGVSLPISDSYAQRFRGMVGV